MRVREKRWFGNGRTDGRTTATLVRTERASQVRVTGGICVNQASKPTTGIGAVFAADGVRARAGRDAPVIRGVLVVEARYGPVAGYPGPEVK
jgi:hypothetical protein